MPDAAAGDPTKPEPFGGHIILSLPDISTVIIIYTIIIIVVVVVFIIIITFIIVIIAIITTIIIITISIIVIRSQVGSRMLGLALR